MRKNIIVLVLGMLIFTGCAKGSVSVGQEKADNISSQNLKSKVSSEECGICGEDTESLMGYYRGMDSVGVVCLNTMGICNSDVREYDDNGNELFGGSGGSTRINSYGEGECHMMISGIPSRGISTVNIDYGEKSEPDFDSLQETLCQNCLDKVIEMYDEEMEWNSDGKFPDACLVDFMTNELYPLGSHNKSYYIRDYFVNIEHGEDMDNVLVFYAPERY